MKKIIYLLLAVTCWGCVQKAETEKHQKKREHIIHVREQIKELVLDDVLINGGAWVYLIDDYLFIRDHKSMDKHIHIFDKNNFNYITGFADRGQGPGEITLIGHIAWDKVNRSIYVSDHGKQRIFSYPLDSVLHNESYMPGVKMNLNNSLFPDRYHYIHDTLSLGIMIKPVGNSDFKQFIGKWNMTTGEIKRMKYEHPSIEKKRIAFAVSMDNGMYVECYRNRDLMTICDLDGNLKYNIYGPAWGSESKRMDYYGDVVFCGNRILALFSGKESFSVGKNGRKATQPTKFLVFNLDGDYVQTLETGLDIIKFCYDSQNNRIIMSFNDEEMQFGQLDLDGLLKSDS
jgi:hypothetical protein